MIDRDVWLSRRALGLHAVIIVIVPTFVALCAWQLSRALGGNNLSWAYVFEWPFFAGYAIYMWWRFLHEAPPVPDGAEAQALMAGGTPALVRAPTEAVDAEAMAYNRYLAELDQRGQPKRWREPRRGDGDT